ncbi:MAG: hypothetical protein WC293_01050 [Candidatus Omnitrophota bacterium]|jgi:hypothetical protein|nr:hypothetical protein [Candidatus Omnitrophota bacterium]MDD5664810.1 hypothetical protein [Candidatus Omnitrophota bacterium]
MMCLLRLIFVLIFLSVFVPLPCNWAQDEAVSQKTVSGIVIDLDWVSSIITVLYFDPFSGNQDEINITITHDTKITRGTEAISFSDLEQSDPVMVVYYDDGSQVLKAKRISDMNLGNR